KSSPVIVGVTPSPRPRMQDSGEMIESQLLESSVALTVRRERTRNMSDAAIGQIKQIASLTKKIGPSLLYVAGNGAPASEAPINETTKQVVAELTGVKYEAFGTLTGALEAIYV